MGKSRRSRRPSNRRLYANYSSTSDRSMTINELRALIGIRQAVPEFTTTARPKRHLAKNVNVHQRARFPKLFGVSTLTSNKPTKSAPRGFSDVSSQKARELKVCLDRSQRKEILFAKKQAGKSGQKTPIRTWKSKVRC